MFGVVVCSGAVDSRSIAVIKDQVKAELRAEGLGAGEAHRVMHCSVVRMDTGQPCLVLRCCLPDVRARWLIAGWLSSVSYEQYFHRQQENATQHDIIQLARMLGLALPIPEQHAAAAPHPPQLPGQDAAEVTVMLPCVVAALSAVVRPAGMALECCCACFASCMDPMHGLQLLVWGACAHVLRIPLGSQVRKVAMRTTCMTHTLCGTLMAAHLTSPSHGRVGIPPASVQSC